ncbi:MAG: DUF4423 domain-containing protein [Myxococcota bacterium]
MRKRDDPWTLVARQLLRAVRGKRSQVAFSRRLGYRGRPVADWEAGRRFPTAATLLRACGVAGIDVPAAFSRFHPPSAASLGTADDAGIAAWLEELRSGTPFVTVARRSGFPRFSVSRWLSGQSRPRVPQFLALVEALTGRAADLVAELVDIASVPVLRKAYERRSSAKRLAFEEPWSAAILRVIETSAYASLPRHSPGWIGEVLGIDEATERRCLGKLLEAGMISPGVSGRFVTVPSTVDTHATEQEMRQLKAHWARVGMEKVERLDPGDIFSFNVISASSEDMDRIRQLLRTTYREIRGIVAASTPVESVGLVQLQLAVWNPENPEAVSRRDKPG